MFKIKIIDSFESREKEIIFYPQLDIWDNTADDRIQTITDIRKTPSGYWLACTGVGAIEIDCENKQIQAYPAKEAQPEKFEYFLRHNWLPLAYQACGAQVIHASAVVHLESRKIVLFCGESGSGKSTLAYGLGQRLNWQQIADDRLAFTILDGTAIPQFIPDSVKLRPASADHFNQEAFSFEEIRWYSEEIRMTDAFILELVNTDKIKTAQPFSIERLTKTEAYPNLLKQAFSLTPEIQELNINIIQDYLVLANQVVSYKLSFPVEFNLLDGMLDEIEEILLSANQQITYRKH